MISSIKQNGCNTRFFFSLILLTNLVVVWWTKQKLELLLLIDLNANETAKYISLLNSSNLKTFKTSNNILFLGKTFLFNLIRSFFIHFKPFFFFDTTEKGNVYFHNFVSKHTSLVLFGRKVVQIACGGQHYLMLTGNSQFLFHHDNITTHPNLFWMYALHSTFLSDSRFVYGVGGNGRGQLGIPPTGKGTPEQRILEY